MGDICGYFFFIYIHVYDNRQISRFLSSSSSSLYQGENIVHQKKMRQRLKESNNRWTRRHRILSFHFFLSTNCCSFLFTFGHGCLTLNTIEKREKWYKLLLYRQTPTYHLLSIIGIVTHIRVHIYI